jgi:hypothetical protein
MVGLCPPIGKRGATANKKSKKQKEIKKKAASEGTMHSKKR